MSDHYGWSSDYEIFHYLGIYESREDALKACMSDYPDLPMAYICTLTPYKPNFMAAAEQALEQLYEEAEDEIGETAERWEIINNPKLTDAIARAIRIIVENLEPYVTLKTVEDITEHKIGNHDAAKKAEGAS